MEHKKIAVACFNEAWNYLDMLELDVEQKTELLHLVHTSRYHWGQVGTDLEKCRGEWQVSRAYSKCELPKAALLHGDRCLEFALKAKLDGFDLAFAYEAIARSKKSLGLAFELEFEKAMSIANAIDSKDDKDYTIGEIKSIRG